jgi:hypothetical protein
VRRFTRIINEKNHRLVKMIEADKVILRANRDNQLVTLSPPTLIEESNLTA